MRPARFSSNYGKSGVKLSVAWGILSGPETRGMADDERGIKSEMDLRGSGLVKLDGGVDVKEKSGKRGEGVYCWVAWEGKKVGEEDWDDGEGEVVRGFDEVVRGAEK